MTDSLSLTAIAAVVLTEGIKFLYGQAAEVLKHWREHKDYTTKNAGSGATQPALQPAAVPPILEGQFSAPVIHFDRVGPLEADLKELLRALSDYVDGTEEADAGNHDLLVRVDALRRLLEAIYGQRITFQGEQRPPSGTPVVVGITELQQIAGYAAAVQAKQITRGEVRGELRADRVEQGARVTGVEVDILGRLADPDQQFVDMRSALQRGRRLSPKDAARRGGSDWHVMPATADAPTVERAGPPSEHRYLNAGFFAQQATQPLAPVEPPALDRAGYRLGVNVGRFWGPGTSGTPIDEALLSPLFDQQPALEVDIVARSLQVQIEPDRQRLVLARSGDSPLVFFNLTFRSVGRQAIDVDLLYRGHLLQSRRTEVHVVAHAGETVPQSAWPVQDGYITFNRTAKIDPTTLQPLDERPSRLTIVAQRDLEFQRIGLHFYDTTGADVGMQQSHLTDASLTPVMGAVRKQLATTMQAYSGSVGGSPAVLEKHFGQQLNVPLVPGQVIQVAPLSSQVGVPWELLYERKLETYRDGRTKVCTTFADHGPELLACPGNADPTVVCPHGFWGYRYVIEQLPAQVKPHAPLTAESLPLQIPNAVPLQVNAIVYAGFQELAPHLDRLRALAPSGELTLTRIDTLDGARLVLSDPKSQAGILHFYSHGGSNEFGAPYLEVGAGDRVTLNDLDAWGLQLETSRPLIVFNACESVEYVPETFENLIQYFCDHGAAGVIGTQCEVREHLAGAFVLRFLAGFLRQQTAGQALFAARQALLRDANPDPRGLVYSLFAAADLRLAQPVLA